MPLNKDSFQFLKQNKRQTYNKDQFFYFNTIFILSVIPQLSLSYTVYLLQHILHTHTHTCTAHTAKLSVF